MKKIYILSIASVVMAGAISFQKSGNFKIEKYFAKNGHKLNANGAPAGQTGAPGESNCTSCHGGTAQSGATENQLSLFEGLTPVTTYLPGGSYSVMLQMASDPAKKGFQAIVLDGTNSMAGTFVGTSNTTISGTTKKYANHNSTSNTSSVTAWLWTWNAPATNVGNVTFYVATNKANNNGNVTGDVIYLSQHVIAIAPDAGVSEIVKEQANFKAGYSVENNSLVLNFNTLSAGNLFVNLVDLNGKSVFTYDFGNVQIGENKQTIKLPAHIKNGMYVAHVFVNNNAMSANILVQK